MRQVESAGTVRGVWGLLVGFLVVGLMFAVVGCGGGGNSLSGKVTVKGKPWKDGVLSFYPKDGKARSTRTDQEGNYTWKDAAEGEVDIVPQGDDIPKDYQQKGKFKTTVSRGSNTKDIVVP